MRNKYSNIEKNSTLNQSEEQFKNIVKENSKLNFFLNQKCEEMEKFKKEIEIVKKNFSVNSDENIVEKLTNNLIEKNKQIETILDENKDNEICQYENKCLIIRY